MTVPQLATPYEVFAAVRKVLNIPESLRVIDLRLRIPVDGMPTVTIRSYVTRPDGDYIVDGSGEDAHLREQTKLYLIAKEE